MIKPVQTFEALPEEKQTVVIYALEHPGVRHRGRSICYAIAFGSFALFVTITIATMMRISEVNEINEKISNKLFSKRAIFS